MEIVDMGGYARIPSTRWVAKAPTWSAGCLENIGGFDFGFDSLIDQRY